MDDPVAAEVEDLRYDLAFLSRLRANVQPDKIAVQACDEVMRGGAHGSKSSSTVRPTPSVKKSGARRSAPLVGGTIKEPLSSFADNYERRV